MTNKTKGFIYGAIAAASYGMNPLFALPLYAAGMNVDTVLFYRYFFATIVLGILMKMQHQSFALHKADVLPLVIMGLLFSFSSLLLFMSYNYMDAGIASTILFVYPVTETVRMPPTSAAHPKEPPKSKAFPLRFWKPERLKTSTPFPVQPAPQKPFLRHAGMRWMLRK